MFICLRKTALPSDCGEDLAFLWPCWPWFCENSLCQYCRQSAEAVEVGLDGVGGGVTSVNDQWKLAGGHAIDRPRADELAGQKIVVVAVCRPTFPNTSIANKTQEEHDFENFQDEPRDTKRHDAWNSKPSVARKLSTFLSTSLTLPNPTQYNIT